jgi:hypothetical protein
VLYPACLLDFDRLLSSSELEACVKNFDSPVFRSCSSVAEGKIKFELFTEKIAQMFSGPDPFSGVAGLLLRKLEEGSPHKVVPAVQSITPVPVVPKHSPSPRSPQVAESSNSASKRRASGSLLGSLQKARASRPGDGWYVAHNAVIPGVYYGV